jgi:hypothetical protein
MSLRCGFKEARSVKQAWFWIAAKSINFISSGKRCLSEKTKQTNGLARYKLMGDQTNRRILVLPRSETIFGGHLRDEAVHWLEVLRVNQLELLHKVDEVFEARVKVSLKKGVSPEPILRSLSLLSFILPLSACSQLFLSLSLYSRENLPPSRSS